MIRQKDPPPDGSKVCSSNVIHPQVVCVTILLAEQRAVARRPGHGAWRTESGNGAVGARLAMQGLFGPFWAGFGTGQSLTCGNTMLYRKDRTLLALTVSAGDSFVQSHAAFLQISFFFGLWALGFGLITSAPAPY
ncbi:uncharacterized protein SPSK_10593 [Sporothrix schenckii 1099-18]|uniref:Uncharacterized protein n=1 Tax=Sporothrix schenckii 1099-18 TaxID=1397361 RepID=A0A0F2M3X0_SPOSC|nr:uncharacterized protein SPSK_10593 [Sporothrix schenckii 1099-18]KJR83465.1 hypothetical protein SPSK_10593 [Sporothrix schenckii 1099-18]